MGTGARPQLEAPRGVGWGLWAWKSDIFEKPRLKKGALKVSRSVSSQGEDPSG